MRPTREPLEIRASRSAEGRLNAHRIALVFAVILFIPLAIQVKTAVVPGSSGLVFELRENNPAFCSCNRPAWHACPIHGPAPTL